MQRSRVRRAPARKRRLPLLGLLVGLAAVLSVGGSGAFAPRTGMAQEIGASAEAVSAQAAGLTITNTVSPGTIASGDFATFTIVATNTSGTPATGVTLATGTSGLSDVTLRASAGSCANSAGQIVCSIRELGPGQSMTLTVNARAQAPAGTVINNTATVNGMIGVQTSSATATAALNIAVNNGGNGSLPDLTTVLTAPAQVAAGGSLIFNVAVNNTGGTNTTNVKSVTTLPAGVIFITTNASSNFVCVHAAGVVTCTGGAVSAGGTATIAIQTTVAAAAGTTLVATTVVDSDSAITESNERNNTASSRTSVVTSVTPNGTLTITKTGAPQVVAAGGVLTYTIRITNTSVSDSATGLTVTDPTTLVAASIVAQTTVGTCTIAAATVTCNAPALSPGQTMEITITGTENAGAGATIANTATVTATLNGAVSKNATANNQVVGVAGIDLTATKTGPATVAVNSPIQWTITVSNIGNTNAAGVTVDDVLPAGLPAASATGTNGFTCARGRGDLITCTGGSIVAGGTATITVNATSPAAAGVLTNTVNVDPANTIGEANEANNTATATTTVNAAPGGANQGLTITKNSSPNPVNIGGTLTSVIVVTNTSATPMTDMTVSDGTTGLEAASVQASASKGSCTVSATQAVCTMGAVALNPGESLTMTVRGNVVQTPSPTIVNTATATAIQGRNTVSATASATTTVRPSVDLNISKSGAPNPVNAGAVLTYTITVGNSGTSTATGVAVRDNLPAGLANVAANGTNGFVCVVANPIVTCTGATITSNGTATITITADAPQTLGVIVNTATVDPDNAIAEADEANNVATANVTVGPGVDLIIAKTSPSPVAPLATFAYTVTVTNQGTQNAIGVKVLDNLPSEVTFVSVTSTNGFNCNFAANPVKVVTCTGGTINFGQFATITITVQAPNFPVTLINNCTVDPDSAIPETNENNNTCTFNTVVQPTIDLEIQKTQTTSPTGTLGPAPGETLIYTVTVTNSGTLVANGVVVEDSLGPALTFVDAIATNGSLFTCTNIGQVIRCSGGTLAANGGTATITIRAIVNGPAGTVISNQAVIDPANAISESDETDNTAQVQTTITAKVDLQITKQAAPEPVTQNGVLTYTITVTNQGTLAATGVKVIDQLPTGTVYQSYTANGGFTCTHTLNPIQLVTCTGGSLAANGGSATITIVVHAPNQTGSITNTVTVDPDNAIVETLENNNTATATSTVNTGLNGNFIDLTIAKQAPAQVLPGGQITYTLTVSNSGTAQAFNVRARDILPTGTTFVSAVGSGSVNQFVCSHLNGIVDCIASRIDNGFPETITIVVTAPQVNNVTIRNQAVVDPGNDIREGNESNNTATADTLILATLDLNISKLDSPDPVAPGGILTYTVTVNATGVGTANNILVRDTLPVGVTVQNVTATNGFICNQNGQVINCTGSLTAVSSTVITITVLVTAPNGTVLENNAVVDPLNAIIETLENNNAATATTNVTANVNLTTALTPSTATPAPGTSFTINWDVTNTLAGNANNVVAHLNIPPATGTVTVNPNAGWSCSTSPTQVVCTGNLLGAVTATHVVTITLPVNVPNGTQLTFNAVADPANAIGESSELDNTAETTVTVTAPAVNLTTSFPAVSNATPAPGSTITVTWRITSDAAANGVRAVLNLAPGMDALSVTTAAGWACATPTPDQVVCDGSFAAAGNADQVVTILIPANAPNGTVLAGNAIVDPNGTVIETNEGDNTASFSVTVTVPNIDLEAVSITPTPAQPVLGQNWNLVALFRNNGTAAAANAQFRVILPNGLLVTSSIPGLSMTSCIQNGQVIDCTATSIAGGGGTAQVTINGTVTGAVGANMPVTAIADPNNAVIETTEANNTTVINPTVAGADVDLRAIALSVSGNMIGEIATVSATFDNNGTATVNNATFRLVLPVALNVQGITWGANMTACLQNGQVINCTAISVPAAGTATIAVTGLVTGPVGASFEMTSIADPNNAIVETNEGNNTLTLPPVVLATTRNLTVALNDPADPPTGNPITYQMTVTNGGTLVSNNVKVVLNIPVAGLITNVSAPAGWTCTTFTNPVNQVVCVGNTMAPAGTAAIDVEFLVAAATGTIIVPTAFVDPDNTIPENNDLDNTGTSSQTVL